jgi:hypothetical protein
MPTARYRPVPAKRRCACTLPVTVFHRQPLMGLYSWASRRVSPSCSYSLRVRGLNSGAVGAQGVLTRVIRVRFRVLPDDRAPTRI